MVADRWRARNSNLGCGTDVAFPTNLGQVFRQTSEQSAKTDMWLVGRKMSERVLAETRPSLQCQWTS